MNFTDKNNNTRDIDSLVSEIFNFNDELLRKSNEIAHTGEQSEKIIDGIISELDEVDSYVDNEISRLLLLFAQALDDQK